MEPGRNDPCPCGSGRKYKRCHGAGSGGQSAPARIDTAELLQHALAFHRNGDLASARKLYQQVLRQDPDNADAVYFSGVAALQSTEFAAAIAFLERAVALRPLHAEAQNNLGVALKEAGRLPDAIAHFNAAIAASPQFSEAQANLGAALRAAGDLDGALQSYRQALSLNPAHPGIMVNLAGALRAKGSAAEAESMLRTALDLEPGDAAAGNSLAAILMERGESAEARTRLEQAVASEPTFAEALNSLGVMEEQAGNGEAARALYSRAVASDPGYAEALDNLGNMLARYGRLHEAVDCFKRALKAQPGFTGALLNLGAAFMGLEGAAADALDCYRQLIAQQPASYEAWFNLGTALSALGESEEARDAFSRALAIRPNAGLRIRMALLLPVIMGTADEVAASRARQQAEFDALEAAELSLTHPEIEVGATNFYLAYQGGDDRDLQAQLARIYERACPSLLWTAPHCLAPAPHQGPRRIGFVSRLLKDHSVGRAIRGLIEGLSPERFSVSVFSFSSVDDAVSQAIRRSAREFVTLPHDLSAARQMIAASELDVLIYPDIGMEPLTYFLAFSRLAPVQCATWGHSTTTGIRNVDYFLSNAGVEPADADHHYSERLVRLESPSYPAMPRPRMPERLKARREFGLADGAHLYVCPQSLFKLHPDFDALAGAILRRDPAGRLVLLEGGQPRWTELIKARFARTIPDCADRVVFVPRMGSEDFRNLVAVCDVMLDSIHVGGGMTTLDGFVAGVPVVTLPGRMMRGRFTAAWCRHIGVADCVAANESEYVDLALRLACEPAWRVEVSRRVRENCGVLFEDRDAVREFEEFFATVAPAAAAAN